MKGRVLRCVEKRRKRQAFSPRPAGYAPANEISRARCPRFPKARSPRNCQNMAGMRRAHATIAGRPPSTYIAQMRRQRVYDWASGSGGRRLWTRKGGNLRSAPQGQLQGALPRFFGPPPPSIAMFAKSPGPVNRAVIARGSVGAGLPFPATEHCLFLWRTWESTHCAGL